MPAALDEVRKLVHAVFPDSDVSEIVEENQRVIGTIRSKEFKDLEIRERNRLVTEKVRDPLGIKGLNVGILFPLAPDETL